MITGVLLAAGRGSRFGTNKLLCPLADGLPMVVVTARKLLRVLPHAIAVTRPGDAETARLLVAEGMSVVVNNDAERGMGVSLARGVAATTQTQGWVIALADMPFIRMASIRGVVQALENGAPLAAPEYRGKRGHPVAFCSAFRTQLERLEGDSGARYLLQRYARHLQRLSVDDPGILIDIDTQYWRTMPCVADI